MRAVVLAIAALGCKSKKLDEAMPEPPPAPDAIAPVTADAAKPWPELEGYTRVLPERVIALPAKPDTPKFTLGGPLLVGDLAIVSSSQFGFVAADWKKGTIAWTKNAGTQVAPPVQVGEDIVLIGDCAKPPAVGAREVLVGCLRVVTPTGAEQNYIAIRGKPEKLEPFIAERGDQATSQLDDHTVKWQRGEAAIAIDIVTGVAKPVEVTPPTLAVSYKGKRWDIAHVDGRVIAYRGGTRKVDWQTQYPYTRVLGIVHTEDNPILRIANANKDVPYIDLIDIDATGSLHAQVAKPTPGIDVLASAVSSTGDAVLAVRVDSSLRRDVVAGYAANALHVWVYPLPEHQRVDRVGVAISRGTDLENGAVVVFHDGDTLTVLPELSAAPTPRGASDGSSKKPTP